MDNLEIQKNIKDKILFFPPSFFFFLFRLVPFFSVQFGSVLVLFRFGSIPLCWDPFCLVP